MLLYLAHGACAHWHTWHRHLMRRLLLLRGHRHLLRLELLWWLFLLVLGLAMHRLVRPASDLIMMVVALRLLLLLVASLVKVLWHSTCGGREGLVGLGLLRHERRRASLGSLLARRVKWHRVGLHGLLGHRWRLALVGHGHRHGHLWLTWLESARTRGELLCCGCCSEGIRSC